MGGREDGGWEGGRKEGEGGREEEGGRGEGGKERKGKKGGRDIVFSSPELCNYEREVGAHERLGKYQFSEDVLVH